jgi:hypothetical protein
MKETKDNAIDKDLAGNSQTEVYSMTDNSNHGHPEHSSNDSKADPAHPSTDTPKQAKNSLLYWRVGLGFLLIFLVCGIGYFGVKGFNAIFHKVSGQAAPAPVVTYDLRSNADPLSAHPTEPVVSNMNIVPATDNPSVTNTNSTTAPSNASSGAQVLGASHSSNNCPAYVTTNYYYCEWTDSYTYRPYNSKAEYDDAHKAVSYSPDPLFTPSQFHSVPSQPAPTPSTASYNDYQQSINKDTPAAIAANGCPSYAAAMYDHCVYYGQYVWRGFRAGE